MELSLKNCEDDVGAEEFNEETIKKKFRTDYDCEVSVSQVADYWVVSASQPLSADHIEALVQDGMILSGVNLIVTNLSPQFFMKILPHADKADGRLSATFYSEHGSEFVSYFQISFKCFVEFSSEKWDTGNVRHCGFFKVVHNGQKLLDKLEKNGGFSITLKAFKYTVEKVSSGGSLSDTTIVTPKRAAHLESPPRPPACGISTSAAALTPSPIQVTAQSTTTMLLSQNISEEEQWYSIACQQMSVECAEKALLVLCYTLRKCCREFQQKHEKVFFSLLNLLSLPKELVELLKTDISTIRTCAVNLSNRLKKENFDIEEDLNFEAAFCELEDILCNIEKKVVDCRVAVYEKELYERCWKCVESSILRKLRPLDPEKLMFLIEHTRTTENAIRGKDVILLLGCTGAGKSTLVHFLCGSKFNKVKKAWKITFSAPGLNSFKTSSEMRSETLLINAIDWQRRPHETLTVCDTPGFNDTRGPEVDIANGICVSNAVNTCRSVRPLVVISESELGRTSRYQSLISSIIGPLVNMVEDIEHQVDSFTYFYTKLPPEEASKVAEELTLKRDVEQNQQYFAVLNSMVSKMRGSYQNLPAIVDLNDKPSEYWKIIMAAPPIQLNGQMRIFKDYAHPQSILTFGHMLKLNKLFIEKALRRGDFAFLTYKLRQFKTFVISLHSQTGLYAEVIREVQRFMVEIMQKCATQLALYATADLSISELYDILAEISEYIRKLSAIISIQNDHFDVLIDSGDDCTIHLYAFSCLKELLHVCKCLSLSFSTDLLINVAGNTASLVSAKSQLLNKLSFIVHVFNITYFNNLIPPQTTLFMTDDSDLLENIAKNIDECYSICWKELQDLYNDKTAYIAEVVSDVEKIHMQRLKEAMTVVHYISSVFDEHRKFLVVTSQAWEHVSVESFDALVNIIYQFIVVDCHSKLLHQLAVPIDMVADTNCFMIDVNGGTIFLKRIEILYALNEDKTMYTFFSQLFGAQRMDEIVKGFQSVVHTLNCRLEEIHNCVSEVLKKQENSGAYDTVVRHLKHVYKLCGESTVFKTIVWNNLTVIAMTVATLGTELGEDVKAVIRQMENSNWNYDVKRFVGRLEKLQGIERLNQIPNFSAYSNAFATAKKYMEDVFSTLLETVKSTSFSYTNLKGVQYWKPVLEKLAVFANMYCIDASVEHDENVTIQVIDQDIKEETIIRTSSVIHSPSLHQASNSKVASSTSKAETKMLATTAAATYSGSNNRNNRQSIDISNYPEKKKASFLLSGNTCTICKKRIWNIFEKRLCALCDKSMHKSICSIKMQDSGNRWCQACYSVMMISECSDELEEELVDLNFYEKEQVDDDLLVVSFPKIEIKSTSNVAHKVIKNIALEFKLDFNQGLFAVPSSKKLEGVDEIASTIVSTVVSELKQQLLKGGEKLFSLSYATNYRLEPRKVLQFLLFLQECVYFDFPEVKEIYDRKLPQFESHHFKRIHSELEETFKNITCMQTDYFSCTNINNTEKLHCQYRAVVINHLQYLLYLTKEYDALSHVLPVNGSGTDSSSLLSGQHLHKLIYEEAKRLVSHWVENADNPFVKNIKTIEKEYDTLPLPDLQARLSYVSNMKEFDSLIIEEASCGCRYRATEALIEAKLARLQNVAVSNYLKNEDYAALGKFFEEHNAHKLSSAEMGVDFQEIVSQLTNFVSEKLRKLSVQIDSLVIGLCSTPEHIKNVFHELQQLDQAVKHLQQYFTSPLKEGCCSKVNCLKSELIDKVRSFYDAIDEEINRYQFNTVECMLMQGNKLFLSIFSTSADYLKFVQGSNKFITRSDDISEQRKREHIIKIFHDASSKLKDNLQMIKDKCDDYTQELNELHSMTEKSLQSIMNQDRTNSVVNNTLDKLFRGMANATFYTVDMTVESIHLAGCPENSKYRKLNTMLVYLKKLSEESDRFFKRSEMIEEMRSVQAGRQNFYQDLITGLESFVSTKLVDLLEFADSMGTSLSPEFTQNLVEQVVSIAAAGNIPLHCVEERKEFILRRFSNVANSADDIILGRLLSSGGTGSSIHLSPISSPLDQSTASSLSEVTTNAAETADLPESQPASLLPEVVAAAMTVKIHSKELHNMQRRMIEHYQLQQYRNVFLIRLCLIQRMAAVVKDAENRHIVNSRTSLPEFHQFTKDYLLLFVRFFQLLDLFNTNIEYQNVASNMDVNYKHYEGGLFDNLKDFLTVNMKYIRTCIYEMSGELSSCDPLPFLKHITGYIDDFLLLLEWKKHPSISVYFGEYDQTLEEKVQRIWHVLFSTLAECCEAIMESYEVVFKPPYIVKGLLHTSHSLAIYKEIEELRETIKKYVNGHPKVIDATQASLTFESYEKIREKLTTELLLTTERFLSIRAISMSYLASSIRMDREKGCSELHRCYGRWIVIVYFLHTHISPHFFTEKYDEKYVAYFAQQFREMHELALKNFQLETYFSLVDYTPLATFHVWFDNLSLLQEKFASDDIVLLDELGQTMPLRLTAEIRHKCSLIAQEIQRVREAILVDGKMRIVVLSRQLLVEADNEKLVRGLAILKAISGHVPELKTLSDGKIDEVLETTKKQSAQRSIDISLILRRNPDNISVFAMILSDHAIFKGEQISLFNTRVARFTIDDALHPDIGISGDSINRSLLLQWYTKFKLSYEEAVKEGLINAGEGIKEVKKKLKVSVLNLVTKYQKLAESKDGKSLKYLVNIFSYLFAYWTLSNANYYFENLSVTTGTAQSSDSRKFLLMPHVGQVLALFRLFGIDDSAAEDEKLKHHLIQISTGEGKSVVLAMTAVTLALLGNVVHCACYSEYLSNRDYDAFTQLFEDMDVKDDIIYSTFNDLCERVCKNTAGCRNIRQKVAAVLQEQAIQTGVSTASSHNTLSSSTNKPKVLLIDEVDVFFTEEFYGKQYRIMSTFSDATIKQLFHAIWNLRSQNVVSISKLKQLPAYQTVIKKFPKIEKLITECCKTMLLDLRLFPQHKTEHDYRVVNDEIGYKVQDGINFKVSHGYQTLYAYLQAFEEGAISQQSLDAQLGLLMDCGYVSYAEIPKLYKCILGVTGTLTDLSPKQQALLQAVYQIRKQTVIPSVYGQSNRRFDPLQDMKYISDTSFFDEIMSQILHYRVETEMSSPSIVNTSATTQYRPVLVFFESKKQLLAFYESENIQHNSTFKENIRILTEDEVIEKESIIRFATSANAVTFLCREFGRGTDFIIFHDSVEAMGGVHVIQTFVPLDNAEETQIRGRSARQGCKGSFSIVARTSNLLEFGITMQEMLSLTKDKLDEKRLLKFTQKWQSTEIDADGLKADHQKTFAFLQYLGGNQKAQILSYLENTNIAQGYVETCKGMQSRTVVMMDATGSMSHLLNSAKNAVKDMFDRAYDILKKDYAGVVFKVQFMAYRNYNADEAQLLQVSNWEETPEPLKRFMDGVHACFGISNEAIEVGFWHVNQDIARSPDDKVSQIILIGDVPPNTREQVVANRKSYGYNSYSSKYPAVYYEDELKNLIANKVKINCFYVDNCAREAFTRIAAASGGECKFLDLRSPAVGGNILIDFVTTKILKDIGGEEGGDILVREYISKYGFVKE